MYDWHESNAVFILKSSSVFIQFKAQHEDNSGKDRVHIRDYLFDIDIFGLELASDEAHDPVANGALMIDGKGLDVGIYVLVHFGGI